MGVDGEGAKSMPGKSAVTADNIAAFLQNQSNKEVLHFITCGSVDDGKSTLIGRLLFESKAIFDDQLQALESESRQYGTQGEKIDFALLVDGLQAEREQGITIDVAYRFFATDERRFVVADTPGHEQYTRNMATGASTAHLAILLIDARKGVLTQTRRHCRIVAMMGIKHVVLAVNKMDLVAYDQSVFEEIDAAFRAFSAGLGFQSVVSIPLSGFVGDNVNTLSENTPWYRGPTLMAHLNKVDFSTPHAANGFNFPVQYVNRPNLDFRGFSGRVANGRIAVGDAIKVLPSGVSTKVKSIYSGFEQVQQAAQGDAITLTTTDEVDVSRGDVLVAANQPAQVADQFEARLIWLHEHALSPGRQYLLKLACKETTATVTAIKYLEDINSGTHLAAKILGLNDVGVVNLATASPLVFAPYAENRVLGGFILVDKLTFQTVAAGMIDFALRRSENIHWQALSVNKQSRAEMKHQTPKVVWFTGLSGSGKSTISNLLEKRLHAQGVHTYLLDGDNVRHGLNKDLGFTEADRVENIRRVTEVAKLMTDAGLVVLVSFISPYRSERIAARERFDDGEFIEVFVDTPLDECEKRDAKGLYAKAREGKLKNFTGIDSPYERPESPEIRLDTVGMSAEQCVDVVLAYLKRGG